jgi:hypothetical protein
MNDYDYDFEESDSNESQMIDVVLHVLDASINKFPIETTIGEVLDSFDYSLKDGFSVQVVNLGLVNKETTLRSIISQLKDKEQPTDKLTFMISRGNTVGGIF